MRLRAPLPQLDDAKPGDVIIELDSHALMWVGGDKPLVHNTNGKFYGALQQDSKYLAGRAADELQVLRLKKADPKQTQAALKIAQGWAFRSNEPKANAGKQKTPFGRFDPQEPPASTAWDKDAAFRAVRALVRHEKKLPLSKNQGVSCAKFVAYVHQAAALKAARPQSKEVEQVRRRILDAKAYRKANGGTDRMQRAELHRSLVKDHEVAALEKLMPPGMNVSAKHITITDLLDHIKDDAQSAFEHVGQARPYRTPTAAGVQILPVGDARIAADRREVNAARFGPLAAEELESDPASPAEAEPGDR